MEQNDWGTVHLLLHILLRKRKEVTEDRRMHAQEAAMNSEYRVLCA